MNKILIVDASSDNRVMFGLLQRAGYDPISVGSIEAGKESIVNLPPGAVIVTTMRLSDGTAREFINWLNAEDYKFPVLAIVENLNGMEIADVMGGEHGIFNLFITKYSCL